MPTEYPIMDGFLFDTKLKPNLKYRAMALVEYEDLRRAGSLRSRSWTVPEDARVSVPAYDSYEYQVYLKPGSVFPLFTFFVSQRVLTAGGNFSVRIMEACNDADLMTEVFYAGWGSPVASQRRMPRPLVVASPGTLNVEICSTFSQASQPGDVQLILWGAEPVE